jgi:pimeloyl-ACP methyl ester carboxylesterase
MFTHVRKLLVLTLFMGFLCQTISLYGQEEEKPAKKKSPKAGQSQDLEGDRFLTPKDKVRLSATYYYGNADKETAPVLLIHDLNGTRKDFTPLVDRLTNSGYAVMTFDLRGHGKSVKRLEIIPPKIEMQAVTIQKNNSGGGRGQKPKIEYTPVMKEKGSQKLVEYLAADFQPADNIGMITDDLPYLRNLLEKVHVDGMVNMNRLVIIGVGRGAALAAYQATQDWKDRDSDRFTKTLILIAPTELDARVDFSKLFASKLIRNNLSILFAIPDGDTSSNEMAEKIRTAILEKNEDVNLEANFPIINYATSKAVKGEKEDAKTEKTEMTISQIFSDSLGKTVFEFIDNRNKKLEIRWSKLK